MRLQKRKEDLFEKKNQKNNLHDAGCAHARNCSFG